MTHYDLIETSHTGREIYNWAADQMVTTDPSAESEAARLLLQSFWGKETGTQKYPGGDTYYFVSPLYVSDDTDENGEYQVSIKLYRDKRKSPVVVMSSETPAAPVEAPKPKTKKAALKEA